MTKESTDKDEVDSDIRLLPIAISENQQQKIEKYKKKKNPPYHSKMTDAEKLEVYFQKVITIQRIWRQLMTAKQFQIRRLSTNQQKLKLLSRFKKFEIYSYRIVVLYMRLEQKFIISFSVYELEKSTVVFQTFIFVQPIMQYVFGYDWDKVSRSSPEYMNKTLPSLASTIVERMELFTQNDEESKVKVCCRFHLEIPQQLNLERKEDPYSLKKNESVETIEDFPIMQKLKFIVKVQRAYKSFKARRLLKEAVVFERRRQLVERNLGTLLKRTYKKISGEYFRIQIYTNKTSNEEYLLFQIKPASGGSMAKETKAFLRYKVSENKFVNCHGLQLIDYLLTLIRKEQDSLKFYFLDVGQQFQKVEIKNELAEESDDDEENNILQREIEKDEKVTFNKVISSYHRLSLLC
jgi:hypothetical protein